LLLEFFKINVLPVFEDAVVNVMVKEPDVATTYTSSAVTVYVELTCVNG